MWKVYKQTDRRITDDMWSEKLTWAVGAVELKIIFYLWIYWNESWIQKWICLKTDRYFDLYPIMWNVFYLQHHKVESKLKRMGLNHHNMSQFFIFILNVFLYKKRLVYASPHAPSFAPSFSTPMYHICIYLLYKDICN